MDWWQIARAQDGAISHAQLRGGGLSTATISRMATSRELSRVSRGIYLLGGAPPTWRSSLWCAVLATDGVLSLYTAGRLWGVFAQPDDAVHVVVPRDRSVSPRPGVAVHRADLPRQERCVRAGLPVLTRRRTLLDLLRTAPWADAARLADRAVQRGWLERNACDRDLAAYPKRAGNPQLRRIAAQFGDGAAAESERLLHRLLRRAGITGWSPNYPVWADGDLIGVVDVALPELRLAIEIDGMAYHTDVDRFRRDRSRQNALTSLRWTVLRFTWWDLTERPGHVIETIRRFARPAAS